LCPEQIRTYLHHLLVERRLAWSSCIQAAAGLKFFDTKTLAWDVLHLDLPPRTRQSQLPQILSIEELQRLFTHAKNPRHRVLLMTTYAAGLRVSAVVRLQLTDIESERMLLRIEQGKGRKDRYTLLSTRLLTELRAYWHLYRPAPWLFTGLDPYLPMPIGTAQKIYYHAKQRVGITHGHGIHTLRHAAT
jgi:integrase/recombinase XerD